MYFLRKKLFSYITRVQLSNLENLTLIQCFRLWSICQFCPLSFYTPFFYCIVSSVGSHVVFSCHIFLGLFFFYSIWGYVYWFYFFFFREGGCERGRGVREGGVWEGEGGRDEDVMWGRDIDPLPAACIPGIKPIT